MKVSFKLLLASIALLSFASCSKGPTYLQNQSENLSLNQAEESSRPEAIVFKAAGDISSALNEFRELLGPLNTSPGATGGHREVNWDAVPSALTNNNLFPGNFFGSADPAAADGRKRGLICTTPGTGFSISDSDFVFVNPKYGDQFNAFSPKKTFIAVGSTITDNFFKVPGTNTDATVQGFGVVFSDVNNASSTSLQFYDGERLLGSFKVPNVGNNIPGGFSFLGVYFPNDKVTRVRVISGSAPLSSTQDDLSDGGGEDLVIMDDFIYSEPRN
jgi:predicted small lipoprotein YifL